MIDPVTSLAFSMVENRGVFALLLGSGVSRAAGIPTGWEVILELTRRVAAAELGSPPDDPADWYREAIGGEPDYGVLLDKLTTSPDERRAILHRFIEPTTDELAQGLKTPTRAHRAIARLVRDGFVRVIVTTNFDRLTENALREEGVEPTVVSTEDGVLGMTPLIHTRCLVVKVHGDYLDTRIRNTNAELATYPSSLNTLLDRIWDEHGLVTCGWSGEWDVALRDAISRAPSRRYATVWASRAEPIGLSADLLNQRGGRWAKIADADSFFEELQRKVEIQARLSRPHPLSLDLLAATAKRYLANPEQRVSLGELVNEEARRAYARIDSADISGQTQQLPDKAAEFQRRIESFEAAAEPLVRVFWAMGRWGDDTESGLARDLMVEWTTHSSASGLVLWNALRSYPAVLLWYAYGLGLVRAGRFARLYTWLTQTFRNKYDDKELPAIRHLFLQEWEGSREGAWAKVGNLEGHDIFSDYLRQRFGVSLAQEFMSIVEFDRIFERFELLAAVAHAGATYSKVDLAAKADQLMHTPTGRLSRDGIGAPEALSSLTRTDLAEQVVRGGFAGGDPEFYNLILTALRRETGWPRFR
ncbi:SIR2 family protein [Caulobacter mirabilis]|uniref:Uncharacterized protein n=1 Tax=Caulobacter mirabilis TaxID=69666 RepID=A0A2D2AUQ0_9CAUL|nr:SIR2 family protein [Caulobacter mirabilis]ATQ41697.1 hypothetical protein CSW64_04350 [Caulobacter mirabilis]